MARTYDMRRRSRAAAATRAGIINAAHGLLERPQGARLSLQEVADAAGVTRATLYNRVGSRRDLLRAVFVDQGRLIGFERVLAAMGSSDPWAGVIETVRESCRAWGVRPVGIRNTLALAATDSVVRGLVREFELDRRRRLGRLAESALDRSYRTGGIHGADARTTLTLVTGFQAYDHLILEASHDEATAALTRMAASAFGIPSPTE